MFKDVLSGAAAEMGVKLTEAQVETMESYWRALLEKNRDLNLTAITEDDQAALLHFADSLAPFTAYDINGKSAIDVGTGGGFPGVPLKIACPGARVTVLDSTEKKITFIKDACDGLDLEVECLVGRAEELALEAVFRDKYDVAVSRAVARLSVLAELCLPLVKPGGVFLAMKSRDTDQEIQEGRRAIGQLGGLLSQVIEYTLPGTDIVRRLLVIEKRSPTPKGFPRRFSRIKKAPL